MIKFLLLLAGSSVSFLNANSQVPNWDWAKSAGGNDYDYAQSVATDNWGNVYITGYFYSPTITFGSTILTNAGGANTYDLFFAKYDGSGNLLWVQRVGGAGYEAGNAIATDGAGNFYLTGSFNSAMINFGLDTLMNSSGAGQTFIAKFDSAGNVLWAKNSIGTMLVWPNAITVDALYNVYVTGYFYSPLVTFGSDTLSNSSTNHRDIFLVKYDSSGNEIWARSTFGTDQDESHSVATDLSGNIYIAGFYYSPFLIFGSDTLFNTNTNPSFDAFLSKYDRNGNVQWIRGAGGIGGDGAYGVTCDKFGNVYMAGYFFSQVIYFGTISLGNNSFNYEDMFLAKYDSVGNVLWVKGAGGTDEDAANFVITDTSGNVYVAGSYQSDSMTFDNISIGNSWVSSTSFMGTNDIFIAKYDAVGNVLWVKSSSGPSNDYGIAVAADPTENIFITGNFRSSPFVFNPYVLTNPTNTQDIYVAKLNHVAYKYSAITAHFCGDSSYNFNGTLLYTAGMYQDTIHLARYDSVIALYLVSVPDDTVRIVDSVCSGNFYSFNGQNLDTAGSYTAFLINRYGCDSNVVLQLSVYSDTINSGVTISNTTLTANQSNATYQWFDCSADTAIAGATSQSFTPPTSGSYYVRITKSGCMVESPCTNVIITGIIPSFADCISLFPNPGTKRLHVTATSAFPNFTYQITNVIGGIVQESKAGSKGFDLDVSWFSKGVYFIKFRNENDEVVKKFIKE